MSIYDLQRSKRLRAFGQTLGREGLAQIALAVAAEIITDGSYKGAIAGAGKMAAIVQACGFDGYWSEKAELGKQEGDWLLRSEAAKKVERGTLENQRTTEQRPPVPQKSMEDVLK